MNKFNAQFNEKMKWSELSKLWLNILPPFRPNSKDLMEINGLITKHLQRKNNQNALVLGATPEFRDLLFKLNFKVVVVDQHPAMIQAMDSIRAYNNEEDIYGDDWFNFLPKNINRFDIILSDLTQGNIEYERQKLFYENIGNALKKNGLFIDRVLTYHNRNVLYNYNEEFKRFSESPSINLLSLNEMLFKCFTASELPFRFGKIDMRQLYEFVKNEYDNPVLNKYIHFMNILIAPEGIIWYYAKDWDVIL